MASTGGGEVNSEQGDDEQDDYNKTHCTSSSDEAHHGVEFFLQTMHASVRLVDRSCGCLCVCDTDICPQLQLQARKKNLLPKRREERKRGVGVVGLFIETKVVQCL
jgi:hypothetical protein